MDPFSAFIVGSTFPGWDEGYCFFRSIEEEALEDRFTFIPTWHILSREDACDLHVETYAIECDYHAAVNGLAPGQASDRQCPYSVEVEQTSPGSTEARVVASSLEHDHPLDLPEGTIESSMALYALWRKWTEKDASSSILLAASNAIWNARRTFNGLKNYQIEKRRGAVEDQDRIVADVKRFFSAEQARLLLDKSNAGKWLFTDVERQLQPPPVLAGPSTSQPGPHNKVVSSRNDKRALGAPSASPTKKVKPVIKTPSGHQKTPHVVLRASQRKSLARLTFKPSGSSTAVPCAAPASTSTSSSSAPQPPPQHEAPVAPLKKPIEMLYLVDSDDEDVKPVIERVPERAHKPERGTAAPLEPSQPGASLHAFLSSLSSTFTFTKYLAHFLHPDLDVDSAAQLLEIADSPAHKPERGTAAPLEPSQPGASLHAFLSSLSSTFTFTKYLAHFLHPDLDVDSAAQLLEIADSPALLDTLLGALAVEKKDGGPDGETLRGMPLVWRMALKQALEEKVGRATEQM